MAPLHLHTARAGICCNPSVALALPRTWRHQHIHATAQLHTSNEGAPEGHKPLGEQLAALHDERDRALQIARKCVDKRVRLAVKLEGIDDAALRHMKAQEEEEARRMLQDKVAIKRAFVMAQRRSEANLQLASKLEELIGATIGLSKVLRVME